MNKMSEFSTLNGYKVKDKKAIRFYDTVDDMINDNTLKEGMHVKTKGYYSINDGGASEYHITGTESNSDYQEELDNGLYATLIIDGGIINFKSIGGKTNDINFNNSLLLENIIKLSIVNKKFNTIYIPSGYYYFNTSINFVSNEINLNAINIIGDGQNYTGDSGGTVLNYMGSGYFIEFNDIIRGYFKDLNIVGNNTNKCFCINYVNGSFFENINFSNFLNHVWLKKKTAYVYFNKCYFNNSYDGAEGIIINDNYNDGTTYSNETNTEYIYFTDCSMEGLNQNCKHVVINGGEFIYFTRCDICNGEEGISMNTSNWNGILLDIYTRDISFCRNIKNIVINNGTGATGRMSINGHFTRRDINNTNERICVINGNSRVRQIDISGLCDNYTTASYGIELTNTDAFNNLIGEYGNIKNTNSSMKKPKLYDYKEMPHYDELTPTVSIESNVITYDFSTVLEDSFIGNMSVSGVIGGTSNGCNISAYILYATKYGQKLVDYSGTNISNVTFVSRKLVVTLGQGYTPSSDISNLKFIIRK